MSKTSDHYSEDARPLHEVEDVPEEERHVVDRRAAINVIGGAIGAVILAGCGGGGASSSGSNTSGTTSTTTGTTSTSTEVTPEGEDGPYFTDDSEAGYDRSNILSNGDGTET